MSDLKFNKLKIVEYALLCIGLLLVGFYFTERISQVSQALEDVNNFEAQFNEDFEYIAPHSEGSLTTSQPPATVSPTTITAAYKPASGELSTALLASIKEVDTGLWSDKRKKQFTQHITEQENAANSPTGAGPSAVLYVDELKLIVPVFKGTSDAILERGAGWIESTTALDSSGNIGIAAHRDSFFRALKDASEGQVVRLKNKRGERTFKISSIDIVSPTQVEVLQQKQSSQLTLVTCYPFYHVGKAPKRYIVSAVEVL